MQIVALVLVIALAWVVLASLRKGCGSVSAVHGSDAWMVEQHERVVRLGREAEIPDGHPLARLRHTLAVVLVGAGVLAGSVIPLFAADDAKVKAATRRVERGGKMIGSGKVGPGIEETAKGVGATVVEGAKYSGNKLKASGKAAEPAAKGAWQSFKQSANKFGATVKRFFSQLFS
ncbi:MAG TPA: hypothetical protein VIE36_18310 [Methylomirabilota bacterium]|jgi:hypothetical protein